MMNRSFDNKSIAATLTVVAGDDRCLDLEVVVILIAIRGENKM